LLLSITGLLFVEVLSKYQQFSETTPTYCRYVMTTKLKPQIKLVWRCVFLYETLTVFVLLERLGYSFSWLLLVLRLWGKLRKSKS